MSPDDVFRRYQELQAYVGWTEEAARQVASLADLLGPHLAALVDDAGGLTVLATTAYSIRELRRAEKASAIGPAQTKAAEDPDEP